MSLDARVGLRLGSLDLDVRLHAEDGEMLTVVGPNGAGKTTLLRAIAGLLPLDRGRVEVNGQVLEDASTGTRLPPERRPAGVVFQDHRLFPHLSRACRGVVFTSVDRVAALMRKARTRTGLSVVVDVVDNLRAAGVDQLGLLTEQMQEAHPGQPAQTK